MRSTVTSAELLRGLCDPGNQTVWRQYVDRYRPVLLEYGRRLGLTADDAEDAAQQTLVAFLEGFRAGRYDPQKGRLRQWLFGIAAHTIRQARARPRAVQVADTTGTGFFAQLPDEATMAVLWDEEWRTALLAHCLQVVRGEVAPQTYEAFDRFACRDEPAAAVAQALGITENAVYGSKRRVLDRLRELTAQLAEEW